MPVDSSSLLHAAVLECNETAVRFLLKHGANANARAVKNSYNLQNDDNIYCKQMSTEVDQVGEIFSRYRTSSFSCTYTANPAPVSHRTRSQSINYNNHQQNNKTCTPLHIAAANGEPAIVELLISYGADVNAEIDGDYTALLIAVLYKNNEVAKILANQGADLNFRTKCGRTPMYFAVKTRNFEMVSLLLDSGADPNITTDHGVTPLHIAVEKKLPEFVELLLKHGANANATTKTGVTPLHCAVVKGQIDVAEMILKNGGDVSSIMKKGEIDVTPLLWITEYEKKRITDVVQKYAPKTKRSGFYGMFIKKIWKQFNIKKL